MPGQGTAAAPVGEACIETGGSKGVSWKTVRPVGRAWREGGQHTATACGGGGVVVVVVAEGEVKATGELQQDSRGRVRCQVSKLPSPVGVGEIEAGKRCLSWQQWCEQAAAVGRRLMPEVNLDIDMDSPPQTGLNTYLRVDRCSCSSFRSPPPPPPPPPSPSTLPAPSTPAARPNRPNRRSSRPWSTTMPPTAAS